MLSLPSFLRIWSNVPGAKSSIYHSDSQCTASLSFPHLMSGLTPIYSQLPPLMLSPPLPGIISGCSCHIQLCCHWWRLALLPWCLPTAPWSHHAHAFLLPLSQGRTSFHSSSTFFSHFAEIQKMFLFSRFTVFQPLKNVTLFIEEGHY